MLLGLEAMGCIRGAEGATACTHFTHFSGGAGAAAGAVVGAWRVVLVAACVGTQWGHGENLMGTWWGQ